MDRFQFEHSTGLADCVTLIDALNPTGQDGGRIMDMSSVYLTGQSGTRLQELVRLANVGAQFERTKAKIKNSAGIPIPEVHLNFPIKTIKWDYYGGGPAPDCAAQPSLTKKPTATMSCGEAFEKAIAGMVEKKPVPTKGYGGFSKMTLEYEAMADPGEAVIDIGGLTPMAMAIPAPVPPITKDDESTIDPRNVHIFKDGDTPTAHCRRCGVVMRTVSVRRNTGQSDTCVPSTCNDQKVEKKQETWRDRPPML